MTAKRFLNEDDKTDLQTGLESAIRVANEASKTVQEVSKVAQEAAENANGAYSPQNKPTPAEIGALPLNGSEKMTGDLQISTSNEAITALIEYMGYTYLRNARGDGKKFAEIVFNTEEAPMYGVVEHINGQPSIKQYMLYGEHNPPTPEELGAVLSTLPEIEDANASIAESNPTGIKFERWTKTTLNTPYTQGLTTSGNGVVITAVIKGTFATQLSFPIGGRGLYIRHNIVGSIYAWTEYGDFKADGSVPMTGTVLNMSNGEGSLENNGISASIRVRNNANDDSNSVQFVLDNSFRTAPYRKLLLRETVDGVKTDYRLYGEHNKPTASDVGAAEASTHRLQTYTDFSQIGITSGSETIQSISDALPSNSRLQVALTSANTNLGIYPANALQLTVEKTYSNRCHFTAVCANGVTFEGYMTASTWSGWKATFVEHNKPSGSYAGNGSTTTRTITINNVIGKVLLINSDNAGTVVWITNNGGVAKLNDGTLSAINASVAKFVVSGTTGTLTINSALRHLNESGKTYYYYVQ